MRPALEILKGKRNLRGVEVGVLIGGNARDMIENLDIEMIYLVDNFAIGGEKLKKSALFYMSPYERQIKWYFCDSTQIKDDIKDLDFVYIDGSHSYKNVISDITYWLPRIKEGGVLGGHDYGSNEPGVIKAVDELFKEKNTKGADWWVTV